ncbi:MAG: potassium-transporting ATPase subunit KdpC [Candidatus Binataceae bacterium]
MRVLVQSIRITIVLTILTGLIYPLVMTGVAEVIFPWQSKGSVVTRNGQVVGAAIIGQNFATAGYFHSRPSAAGNGYDASNSGASNLGPTNKTLIETVSKRLKDEMEADSVKEPSQVPIDLITTSGSGLDPEISPAAAELQVARVAKVRGLSQDDVEHLVQENTRGRWLGLLGEPGVNVLMLNLALDNLASAKK